MQVNLKLRPGHIKLLKSLMTGRNHYYRLAKGVNISLGTVHTYLRELEDAELIQSKLIGEVGKRKKRECWINKSQLKKVEEIIK